MGMGKQNSRPFSGLFHFQGLNFFPILYNTTFKSELCQPEASKYKGALDFFDSDTGDKNKVNSPVCPTSILHRRQKGCA